MDKNMLELDADAMAERINAGKMTPRQWAEQAYKEWPGDMVGHIEQAIIDATAELEARLADRNRLIREHEAAAVRLCERVDKAEARLTESVQAQANLEALIKATLNGIREEAEGALGYEQMCDASTAAHRLAARLKEAEAKVDELRQDLDVEITAKWKAQARAEKAEADAGRLQLALDEAATIANVVSMYITDDHHDSKGCRFSGVSKEAMTCFACIAQDELAKIAALSHAEAGEGNE